MRWSHLPAQGQRRALDDRMHEGEDIGPTEALQPLCSERYQGLGPRTDHGEDRRSQGLEALIHPAPEPEPEDEQRVKPHLIRFTDVHDNVE